MTLMKNIRQTATLSSVFLLTLVIILIQLYNVWNYNRKPTPSILYFLVLIKNGLIIVNAPNIEVLRFNVLVQLFVVCCNYRYSISIYQIRYIRKVEMGNTDTIAMLANQFTVFDGANIIMIINVYVIRIGVLEVYYKYF